MQKAPATGFFPIHYFNGFLTFPDHLTVDGVLNMNFNFGILRYIALILIVSNEMLYKYLQKTPSNQIFQLDGVIFATFLRSKIEKDYAKCNCSHQAKLDSPAVKVNNLGKKNSSKNILYLD